MSFLENLEELMFQDELPFSEVPNPKTSNPSNEEENNWENEGGPVINNLLETQTSFEE